MAKAKVKPEWQRLIERCQRLWAAYDKAPTKANLEKFGAHLEKMKASKSVKVKAERNRGARAFRQQWKAAGYHMAAKKKASKKKAAKRKRNPPAGSPLRREYERQEKAGETRGAVDTSQWPDYRTVTIMLGTKDARKAFTKVAKELMRLGFAIDYEYEAKWKDGREEVDSRGTIEIQSRSLPLPWGRMSDTWKSVFVDWERAPLMDGYDDEYRGPEDANAAAEALLEKHGGKIPLTYGRVEIANPKKKASKKKAAKRKNPAPPSFHKASARTVIGEPGVVGMSHEDWIYAYDEGHGEPPPGLEYVGGERGDEIWGWNGWESDRGYLANEFSKNINGEDWWMGWEDITSERDGGAQVIEYSYKKKGGPMVHKNIRKRTRVTPGGAVIGGGYLKEPEVEILKLVEGHIASGDYKSNPKKRKATKKKAAKRKAAKKANPRTRGTPSKIDLGVSPVRDGGYKWAQNYVVRGSGLFPVDMLRYDSSFVDPSDPIEGRGLRTVRLTRYVKTKRDQPTAGRWRSFGWEVLGVDDVKLSPPIKEVQSFKIRGAGPLTVSDIAPLHAWPRTGEDVSKMTLGWLGLDDEDLRTIELTIPISYGNYAHQSDMPGGWELLESGPAWPNPKAKAKRKPAKKKAAKKKAAKKKVSRRKANPAVHYPEGWRPSLGRKWAETASRDEIEERLERVRGELDGESADFSPQLYPRSDAGMYRIYLMGDESLLEEALKRFPHPSRREPRAVSGEFEANPKRRATKRKPARKRNPIEHKNTPGNRKEVEMYARDHGVKVEYILREDLWQVDNGVGGPSILTPDPVEAIMEIRASAGRRSKAPKRNATKKKAAKRKAKRKNPMDRLTAKHRNEVNGDLIAGGFDGNGRFKSMGAATNKAWGILAKHGIEQGQVVSADLFRGDSGHITLRMAFSNESDAFSPQEIQNSMLAWQWHWHTPEKLEVVAYAS